MKTIAEQLKHAREASGRTLEDIAAVTRINLSYLQQLEEGNFPSMPQSYLRAFIKDYAHEVGLNSYELLRQLEAAESNRNPEQAQGISASPQKKSRQLNILLALSMIIGLGLAVSMLWMHNNHRSQPLQEISFAEAVNDEQRQQSAAEQMPLSFDSSFLQSRTGMKADSLLLEGVASESVWVRIVADGIHAKEYKLAPFGYFRLKSKNYFSLSLSNAQAISFSLNGQKIGELSNSRKPLWNITLSWDSMKKLLPKESVRKTTASTNEQKTQH